jgi:hypothetical protein
MKYLITLSVTLNVCTFNRDKSAYEVSDKFIERNALVYSVVVMPNFSMLIHRPIDHNYKELKRYSLKLIKRWRRETKLTI